MGYVGKIELRIKAQEMRKKGNSYREIMKVLNVSKASVSIWCKNIQLTESQIFQLYTNKINGALKGTYITAEKKKKATLERKNRLFEEGKREVGILTKRERFLIGIALYAAEGTKTDMYCCFSNSDPALVKFMVDWFKEFCEVDIFKVKGALWLHEGLDELNAKRYWSCLTGIPQNNFYKTYKAKDKKDSKKIRKKKHEYGVFSFYITNLEILRRIMGWIGGITNVSWYNSQTLTS